MKAIILLFLFSFNFLSCQEEYNNKFIFLGEYNESDELKVFKNGNIQFIHRDSLQQSSQYSPKELLVKLDKFKLFFTAEGDEPFWRFRLNSKNLFFEGFESAKEKHYKIEVFVDTQSGFNLMFKSLDNTVFGLIRRVDTKLNSDTSCLLALSDNYLIYEAFITIDQKMYKGCSSIDSKL